MGVRTRKRKEWNRYLADNASILQVDQKEKGTALEVLVADGDHEITVSIEGEGGADKM